MYVRLKLREPNGLVVPRGPGFSTARAVAFEIDGSAVAFRAPKHQPRLSNHGQVIPRGSYTSNEMHFKPGHEEAFEGSGNWDSCELFHNSWAFNGPWFTGTLAELYMYVNVIRSTNKEDERFSLFHPKAFEKKSQII